MKSFFRSLFGRAPTADVIPVGTVPPTKTLPEHHWTHGTTMPIPDWDAVGVSEPKSAAGAALHAYWHNAAEAWLQALGFTLGDGYTIAASENFLMLSPLSERQRKLTLDYSERAHRRILRTLTGAARDAGHGPHVVIVFADVDEYYEYVAHYYPDDGEYAMSAGMCIDRGYTHYVFVASDLDRMEPIIAHELTHALLTHLDIPLWLNEGTAVNTEKHLVPHLAHPRAALYSPYEMAQRHAKFWNAGTIQQFWAGGAFHRPDDGQMLSYDLAERMVKLLAEDYPRYCKLLNAARADDAGASVIDGIYGFGLGQLAEAILGKGDWRPRPELWDERTVETGDA